MRGLGSQTSNHFGTIIHQSDSIGVLQGDSIRNIYGEFRDRGFDTTRNYSGVFSDGTGSLQRTVHNSGTSATPGFSFDAARVVPISNENRPINKAVIYLIKAQ